VLRTDGTFRSPGAVTVHLFLIVSQSAHRQIEHDVGRAGVEGEQGRFPAAPPIDGADVADPPQIVHAHVQAALAEDQAMKEARQGRSRAARRQIGRAKVARDRGLQRLNQISGFSQLERSGLAGCGLMKNRLPMQTGQLWLAGLGVAAGFRGIKAAQIMMELSQFMGGQIAPRRVMQPRSQRPRKHYLPILFQADAVPFDPA
jgi:hypothetical protein